MSDIAQENSPLLNAIGLKKYYPVKKGMFTKTQQVKALDGVSFSLERGKTLAVVGESGCGKSTLGRLLTMIEEPTEGELYYNGQNFLENDHQTKALRRQKIQIEVIIKKVDFGTHRSTVQSASSVKLIFCIPDRRCR